MTKSNVHHLWDARQSWIEKDVERRKELQDLALKTAIAMNSIMDLGASDIWDPKEFKELIDYIRWLVYVDILNYISTIEVDHNLDKITLDDE